MSPEQKLKAIQKILSDYYESSNSENAKFMRGILLSIDAVAFLDDDDD